MLHLNDFVKKNLKCFWLLYQCDTNLLKNDPYLLYDLPLMLHYCNPQNYSDSKNKIILVKIWQDNLQSADMWNLVSFFLPLSPVASMNILWCPIHLIHHNNHLCTLLRIDKIKAKSHGFSCCKQVQKFANARNCGRVCGFWKTENAELFIFKKIMANYGW